jgi:murein L,D-transpeptidase YafK
MPHRWIVGVITALAIGAAATSADAATNPHGPDRAPDGIKADAVLVLKSKRQLLLLRDGSVLRSFHIALGRNPRGAKIEEGDGRTPEGHYVLDWRNPESRYYRSIHISYPSPSDVERAQALGVSPGSEIMIHGLPNGLGPIGPAHVRSDWTEGCIAVTDAEMDEIWAMVDSGTPIDILP